MRSSSCQVLTFPASSKFDNATITFILTDRTEINFLLHVQGILSSPDLTYKDVNSTHIILKWDEPFSWVQPGNISYVLTLIGTDTRMIRLSATSFTTSRPHDVLKAVLTAGNTVGEGENSILNISFDGCEPQGEIKPRALPYQELGRVSVYVELFTLLENIEYCLPDNITVVHDNVKKTVKIMYNNNKVYILLPNVTEVRHVTDFLIWYLSQLHLHYSTYKVQDVSVTGDSYKKTLQCHFLDGTEHDTCFIEVEGDDRPLSGSDVYHFSKPGNHTLRVYDNRAQRDAGAEPAKVLNITIGDVQTEENGEGFTWVIIVGVVLLPVFLLAVIGLLLYCTLRKHACNEVPTRNEDEAEHGSGSNDSQQHGSAVDDIANVVHQATAPEEGKDDLEIGIGEIVITAVGIRNRQRVPAHHRSNENHVAIRIEEECNNKSIKDLPTTEGQQVSSDAEKEVEVTVEGLEIPELHQGPVEENIN